MTEPTPAPPARAASRARVLAAFALAAAALAPPAARAQDAGQMAFMQCADCHSPGDNDGVGPGLKGVVGRKAGTKAGFAYSDAMKKSGLTWNDATLDKFLAAPRDVVPDTAMLFPGVDDPKERAALVAYLKTLK